MKLTVKLFARAKELVNADQVVVELPENATVLDLRKKFAEQFPQLETIAPHLFIAINEDYANDQTAITPNANIACFPPVSGG